jgi:hypothetical protein
MEPRNGADPRKVMHRINQPVSLIISDVFHHCYILAVKH